MIKALRANWIALASSFLFLAAIFYILHQQDKISSVVTVWKGLDRGYLTLAILLTVCLIHPTSAWRLAEILSIDEVGAVRFLTVLRIHLISQFVANGAPISAVADLARATMVKLRYQLSPGRSVRLIFNERLCAALGAAFLGLLASLVLLAVAAHTKLIYAQFALWVFSFISVAALLAFASLRIDIGIPIVTRVLDGIALLRGVFRRASTVLVLLLISIAQMLSFAVVYIALAKSMQLPVPWWYLLLYTPAIFFVSSLPIFYQGWGGREAIIIAALGDLGTVTTTQSVALSVAFGVVMFLGSLPGAIFWIMRPSMRKKVPVGTPAP